MKLLRITHGDALLAPISTTHWKLLKHYWVDMHTDQGVYCYNMLPGWVTDKRSGSHVIDRFIPKEGTPAQLACVLAHDLGYGGVVPFGEANDLLRQGWVLTGIDPALARAAWLAVSVFGRPSYYELDETYKKPYENNLLLEHFRLVAKSSDLVRHR